MNLVWKAGRLVSADLHSKLGEPVRVRYREKTIELKPKEGKRITLDANLEVN